VTVAVALPPGADLRAPEYRREVFQRFYGFHLKYRTHPGLVYLWLPAVADALGLDAEQRAWLVWLNGNTQNPVTSLLLLEAAPHPGLALGAVALWQERYADLEWDTDRRYQKARFAEATERWADATPRGGYAAEWARVAAEGWEAVWEFSRGQPYMGRLSAWSMAEYARLLLPDLPDADSLLLGDRAGSLSHRNGLAIIDGQQLGAGDKPSPDYTEHLADLGESLLAEAQARSPGADRLTLESALCTYKSWHKPNRRYPNVYADLAHDRLRRAEARWGARFDVLWQARRDALPPHLRLEDSPMDPGPVPVKQNHYLTTGRPIMLNREHPDLANAFNDAVDMGEFGVREGYRPWTPTR